MFTVFRLYFQEKHRQRIPEVAMAINRICPNACDGHDRDPLRVSCNIAEGLSWDMHRQNIQIQLVKLMPDVDRYAQFLTGRELDILVEPEDWKHSSFDEYSFEQTFLQLLVQYQIELTLSISRP